jgi:delta-1-pyrroline-5-carboxylate synthetase
MTDGFVKSTESTFGKPHASRETVRNARRVVVKVGTAVVTRHTDNRLALGRLGALVEQLHALVRSGRQVILVTSGAVCVGRQVLRQQHILNSSPLQMMGNHNFCVASKLQAAATIDAELKPEAAPSNIDALPGARAVAPRAAAAAGQTGLMALYDSLFTMMDMQAAQLLVTASDFEHDGFREALTATAEDLLSMNVIPVFNENDAILSAMPLLKEEGGQKRGRFRDNDGLAALLAVQLNADLLMLCTDVDGLFTGNPSDPDSEFIPTYSPEVHKEMISFASKSTNGRGGMMAKVEAAWMAAEQGCSVVILNGKKPDSILQVIAGQLAGTLFNSESARMVELELQAQANGHGGGGAEADARRAAASKNSARDCALRARDASRTLQSLPSEKRVAILQRVAESLLAAQDEILAANEEDVAASSGKIDNTLMQRLKLKPAKLQALAAGIRAIAGQDEPIGRQISKMEIAEGLILEKVSSPIGVVLIIFEARPDALPQIASLAIRSGNGLLLKGGKEAARSNEILHRLIVEAIEDVAPEVGRDLISLVTSREGVSELLSNDDVIDLVIPRGSNSLVSHIQQNTKIPVLGHADGICHIYVDEEADLGMATKIVLDSKSDYPAACNAVEKVLVHSALAEDGRLFKLQAALRDADITMYGGEKSVRALGLTAAPSPRHEYGNLSLTLELVDSMDEAIDHIHKNGSSHTESIVTDNTATAEDFLRRVDAACVDHNTSTRFSDGFRYGLGAEVGISTARIHARGPVGVEGLMTTRFLLRGNGHLVNKDKDIVYTHRPLPINQGANGELTNGGNGH